MYLKIKDKAIAKNVAEEISALTNGAELHIRNVRYDEENGLLVLPITRYGILEKSRLSVFGKSYKYDYDTRINSLITVRNVVDCKIEDKIAETETSTVSLLFGMMIEGNRLYLSSVEEDRGELCYSIDLSVSEIDIEISDEE